MGKRKYDYDHEDAIAARKRVSTIIDAVPPEDLVKAIKTAPSLRGMILGYVAELMFEKHLPLCYDVILKEHIESHDDHDRTSNKADRTLRYKDSRIGIQLKSIQTNTLSFELESKKLRALVQNDGSDTRSVTFSDGTSVKTVCYLVGEYDILAVPLFPFTGKWNFAYKRNADCRRSAHKDYSDLQKSELLATTEIITWPLGQDWTMDLMQLIDPHSIVEVD